MIDQELREAGIQPEDIETRLDGQNAKSLIITKRELIYYDNSRLQRGRLREIVNVKTAKTGELTVKSPTESLIEGSIKGFDLAELKFFFETVKGAIARAKASVTATDLPAPVIPPPAPAPWSEPAPVNWDDTPPAPTSSWDAPAPSNWDSTPAAPSNAWMPDKETLEVGPDVVRNPQKDSWADLESELNPAKTGSTPGLLNPSSMIPAPGPSFPAKAPIDPFADLARSAANRPTSGDDWGNPSSPPINLKPDPAATGMMVAPSASGEWSGEIMDASTALDSKKSNKGATARIGDAGAGIDSIARWLRILSIVFLFVGAILPAALLLESEFSPNLTQLALIVVSFFGGLLIPLIGWGVSELLTSLGKASSDLRSIRKATLGH